MALELLETPNDRRNEGNRDGGRRVVNIDMNENCTRCGEKGATRSGSCLSCVSQNMKFNVPRVAEFEDEGVEYFAAPEIGDIAKRLISKYDEDFGAIKDASFDFFWKKKGGTGGGKAVLGKCQKPTGLLEYYSKTDFVIWLAADNCFGCTEYQITALVFHELKHAGYNRADEKYETRPHDLEAFDSEVAIFGNWKSDITRMGKAFDKAKQLNLFN